MNPQTAKEWVGAIRDFAVVALAVFIGVHEATVQGREPNLYLLGLVGALLGVPFVLRSDDKRKEHGGGDEG